MISNPSDAANVFKEDILSQHATGKPLYLTMDLGDSAEDRERAVLTFYKMANVEWACPLTFTLKGKLVTHTKLKTKKSHIFI